jgi:hypothetical protein
MSHAPNGFHSCEFAAFAVETKRDLRASSSPSLVSGGEIHAVPMA